eukprot:2473502-Rhodomonas_salina.2
MSGRYSSIPLRDRMSPTFYGSLRSDTVVHRYAQLRSRIQECLSLRFASRSNLPANRNASKPEYDQRKQPKSADMFIPPVQLYCAQKE